MSEYIEKPFEEGLSWVKFELESILDSPEIMYSRKPYEKGLSITDEFIESLTELKLQVDLIVEASGSKNEIKKEVSKIVNRWNETEKHLEKCREEDNKITRYIPTNTKGPSSFVKFKASRHIPTNTKGPSSFVKFKASRHIL